jgi:hypothetical protein
VQVLFYLFKILSVFTLPLTWTAALLVLSLLLCWRSRHRAAARWLVLAALVWTALVGWLTLPEALLRGLESRHPAPAAVAAGQLQAYTGVVVLGGSQERLTASVALLRQHPHLRLLFTGGDGKWWASGSTEADQAEAFFKRMGVSADRLAYERASRTTNENAVLGAAVPGVEHASWTDYSLARGAVRWELVLHEAMGLLASYAVGLVDFEVLSP